MASASRSGSPAPTRVISGEHPHDIARKLAIPRGPRMSEARAVPFYCPFCGDEDLRPHEDTHGAWHCRSCTRVFSLKLVGLVGRT